MRRFLQWAGAFCAGAIVAGGLAAYAVQTNYLGVVFIADPTTVTQQAGVTSTGELKVTVSGTPSTLPVPIKPGTVTLTDRSGTIATGGTSQQLAATNTSRLYLQIQNPCSATESLFVNYGSAASATSASIELGACGSVTWEDTSIVTAAVNVIAATTGHRFVAKEGQ